MKRRDFIKTSAGAGLGAGFVLGSGGHDGFFRAVQARSDKYDMIAVMGGSPEAMFDLGIQELGGMGAFVKKGQKVLVKPNIGWDVLPELAANTNPLLVRRVIEHCLKAGAREVYVFDHTIDNWVNCYKNSGIERAAKLAGAKVVPGASEKYYQEVNIPGGIKLRKTKVHELVLDTDVFINVPVLKDHNSVRMTCSLKNMMGVVWDRAYWHKNDLNQCIVDYAMFHRKPALNVIDCYNVMVQHGPQGVSKADVVQMKSLILATDWVAGDTAASRMLGTQTSRIEYIPMAHKLGLGTMDIDTLNIKRIKM
ncbi:MAG TPA: DUF362 domain-containing protein [Bacteroidales bacterium]|jgi:uncharacterized protein (DUF362 family)|nr:DUF362 domain-containing protein [Bacteroidales bacterium]HQH25329.1 DUF362 domain-containing protein [Bacteroidales bacterium]HQJ82871.1 DUF362 domain-containing protein [Bacteroidales bacterium]